jgi:AmiR/NasT family two-component response regulator
VKVIVATDHGLTPDQAFQLLVQQSLNEQRKLWQLAQEYVERRFGTPTSDRSGARSAST